MSSRLPLEAATSTGPRLRKSTTQASRRHTRMATTVTGAALDDDTVDRAVDELHKGHAVLLVNVRQIVAGDARAQLEPDPRAA